MGITRGLRPLPTSEIRRASRSTSSVRRVTSSLGAQAGISKREEEHPVHLPAETGLCGGPLDDGVGLGVAVELDSWPDGTREGHQGGGVLLAQVLGDQEPVEAADSKQFGRAGNWS